MCVLYGYHDQDLFKLWDGDKDGIVRFEEFAVNEALILARFQKWAKERFGSCAAIWDTPQAATASRNIDGTWFREKSMKASAAHITVERHGGPTSNDMRNTDPDIDFGFADKSVFVVTFFSSKNRKVVVTSIRERPAHLDDPSFEAFVTTHQVSTKSTAWDQTPLANSISHFRHRLVQAWPTSVQTRSKHAAFVSRKFRSSVGVALA